MAKAPGLPSYRGYEYQILVSVWLGLDLLLVRQLCDCLTVEPDCWEDVEANLGADAEQAGASVHGADAAGGPLRIQIKHRAGQWDPTSFGSLMRGSVRPTGKRGPAQRETPLQALLRDPLLRYVLVTDTDCSPRLREFVVDSVGKPSSAERLPGKAPKQANEAGVAPRVAVLPGMHEAFLVGEVTRLLGEAGHVASDFRHACLEELKMAIRSRLLGDADRIWTSDELCAALRRFEGVPLEPAELSDYVPPHNFHAIERQLNEVFRLVLAGAPGTGKTLTARKLIHDLRSLSEPFRVVEPTSPSEVSRLLDEAHRHLFYLADPWGHHKPSSNEDLWASELPKLLGRASPDKRFLVTSPTAALERALGRERATALIDSEVSLNPEHYDDRRRWMILLKALAGAAPWTEAFVTACHEMILRDLTVPLSVYFFARRLRQARGPAKSDSTSWSPNARRRPSGKRWSRRSPICPAMPPLRR